MSTTIKANDWQCCGVAQVGAAALRQREFIVLNIAVKTQIFAEFVFFSVVDMGLEAV
jgi:hypothetical protein